MHRLAIIGDGELLRGCLEFSACVELVRPSGTATAAFRILAWTPAVAWQGLQLSPSQLVNSSDLSCGIAYGPLRSSGMCVVVCTKTCWPPTVLQTACVRPPEAAPGWFSPPQSRVCISVLDSHMCMLCKEGGCA